MIFLALADGLRVGRCNMDALTNPSIFLLASLYSTSYSSPRIGRWIGLGAFICGLWMMDMLPFSNYFRSELTTRVTLRSFPDHMDTMVELERALDERRVVPCVEKDPFLHQLLTIDLPNVNLHKKLRSAFGNSKDREGLVQTTYIQCLKCALTKGRFCYSPSLPPWFRSPYKVEWIVLSPDSESIRTLSRYVSETPVRNFTCGLGEWKRNQKVKYATAVHVAPALFSRSCAEQEGRPLDGKYSELRNTVMRTACIDLRYRGGGGKRDCNSYETDIIFDAVKLYNLTVINTFYTAARPLGIDMFHGLIDVHRNLGAARPVSLREFHTPGLIMYWYESFYVKSEELVLLSFQDILDESKFCLTLVSVTLVSTMIFLSLADALRVGRCNMDALTNSSMFLLASFYYTSYSYPRIGRWTGLGAMICGLWMMGMLPFSNYFRSELTTRVTLRAFPDHMDTGRT
ncbi:hypothetical protein HPB50_014274 [Hyalomma asiaticum]|uniref:Uncharacterized protein n=1 Tax=Hyalomma asiaticum TaxID=266040 RepID=A0ACB7SU17_HYAAI|nr:hypothetical protein HPB50_014274 [Hyalomma asiaticum]